MRPSPEKPGTGPPLRLARVRHERESVIVACRVWEETPIRQVGQLDDTEG